MRGQRWQEYLAEEVEIEEVGGAGIKVRADNEGGAGIDVEEDGCGSVGGGHVGAGIKIEDITRVLITCQHCIENKAPRTKVAHNKPIKIYGTWDTMGMDLADWPDCDGEKHKVIICMDMYSRWLAISLDCN